MAYSGTQRKHFDAMTKEEKSYLRGKINEVAAGGSLLFDPHAINRLIERKMSASCLDGVFKSYRIIEFHTMEGEPRVLIRGNVPVNGEDICVVLAPARRRVITVYFNPHHDNHQHTLDPRLYTANIDVLRSYKVFARV